jgi:toxin CcdB
MLKLQSTVYGTMTCGFGEAGNSMAQYDVYPNPNPATREAVPYLLDVQNRLLDQFSTRLVMPLRADGPQLAGAPRRLMPRLPVKGTAYVLYAHQAAAIESRLLKKPVATLAAYAADVLGALDAVTSGV